MVFVTEQLRIASTCHAQMAVKSLRIITEDFRE